MFAIGIALLSGTPSRLLAQTKVELTNGEASVDGVLAKTDPKDPVRNRPAKTFTVELKAGESYQIDMVRIGKGLGVGVDPYLRLEDPAGKQLAQDDDGGGFPNAKITFECPADGAYKIVATSFGLSTGPFTLTVKKLGKEGKVDAAKNEIKLNNGFTQVKSRLAATDAKDKVRKDCYAKVYTVAMKANMTYQIDLKSKDFDAFLRIENAQGNQLDDDDDGGDDLDARLTFACPADGVYRIIATSFGQRDGEFTMIVRELPK